MMRSATGRGCTLITGVALFAVAALAPGCSRPADEAWLQFLGFKQGGTTISVFKDDLREESTITVDVEFENRSLDVGLKTGTGVFVNRARIDYRMSGSSPPAAEYSLNLYLPSPSDGTPTTGTLSGFPLAPTSLKHWLINTHAFDSAASKPVVELSARVTFFGETDEGAKLETEGSIGIALKNTGAISSGTKPTVSVFGTGNASWDTLTNGEFTVFRTGNVTNDLTVAFTTAGGSAISGTDYQSLVSPVIIPAGDDSVKIKVIPLTALAVGKTVKINLSASSSYTLGTSSSAFITIDP